MNPMFDHTFLKHYLSGKMSPVEKESFEMRLEKEPLLRAELAAMKRERGMEETTVSKDELTTEMGNPIEKNDLPATNKLPLVLGLILILLVIMYFVAKG